MTDLELIENREIVIQGLLALSGKRISRTQIVKVVYQLPTISSMKPLD